MSGILLVDDQRIVLDGLKRMVADLNLDFGEIYDALDGQEALRIHDEKKPDIILVDIMMPKMDGLAMIRKLKSAGSDAKIAIVSAYRDFEYARTAIEYQVSSYILKPVTKKKLYPVLLALKDEADESRKNREDKRANELQYYYMNFYDYLTGKDLFFDFTQFSRHIDADFIHPCFKVALFRFGGEDAARQSKKPIDERLAESGIRHLSFPNGRGVLLYILNIRPQDDAFCNATLSQCASLAGSAEAAGASVTLSGSHELKNAYRQAEQALKECMFRGAGMRIHPDAGRKDKKTCFSIEDNSSLVNLLLKGSKTELDEALKTIFTRVSLEDCGVSDMENDIIAMLGFVHIHVNQSYPGMLDIKRAMDSVFYQSDNIFSLKIALKDFFDGLYEAIRKQDSAFKTSGVIRRITEYIGRNYNRELSLHDLAGEIGINYSYLSGLFADELKVSYSEFVTNVRMEKACALLKDTRMKVHDVAESCGWADPKYFFRVFKKRFGITPEEYRNGGVLSSASER